LLTFDCTISACSFGSWGTLVSPCCWKKLKPMKPEATSSECRLPIIVAFATEPPGGTPAKSRLNTPKGFAGLEPSWIVSFTLIVTGVSFGPFEGSQILTTWSELFDARVDWIVHRLGAPEFAPEDWPVEDPLEEESPPASQRASSTSAR